jgi:uncharacterized protein
MSIPVRTPESRQRTDPSQPRAGSGDWDAITAEVNEYGGDLLPQLLTDAETARIRTLYEDNQHFRATVTMGQHRFGEGEYRYFNVPYPEPAKHLKQALYPRLPATGTRNPAVPPRGRTRWTNGCACAMTPGRTSRQRSCCATARETGTPCTATSTETSTSRCRSSST